jgi:DNA adenine methylase
VLRYLGGKWKLAPWIIEHLPPHRIYVEPFGGAASVLLRKPRSFAEIYNELSDDVVNVFRVLRDPASADLLRRAIELTPFARSEYVLAYEPSDDPIEWARRVVLRSFAGFGSGSTTAVMPKGMRTSIYGLRPSTGFRQNSHGSGSSPANDWANWPAQIPAFVERMRGVVIEKRPAREVIHTHDRPEALHYVDPPYMHATRNIHGISGLYQYEMNELDHAELLAQLCSVRGMVVLSAYHNALYDDRLGGSGWTSIQRAVRGDRNGARVEVLWFNPAAQRARAEAVA